MILDTLIDHAHQLLLDSYLFAGFVLLFCFALLWDRIVQEDKKARKWLRDFYANREKV